MTPQQSSVSQPAEGTPIWKRLLCRNEGLNQPRSPQRPLIMCSNSMAQHSDLLLTLVSSACFCPLPCLSDPLRALPCHRKQCTLSRRLVGNVDHPVSSDTRVSRDLISRAQAYETQKKTECFCWSAFSSQENDSCCGGVGNATGWKLSLRWKWKWACCRVYPTASYRVMFHQNKKRNLKSSSASSNWRAITRWKGSCTDVAECKWELR